MKKRILHFSKKNPYLLNDPRIYIYIYMDTQRCMNKFLLLFRHNI